MLHFKCPLHAWQNVCDTHDNQNDRCNGEGEVVHADETMVGSSMVVGTDGGDTWSVDGQGWVGRWSMASARTDGTMVHASMVNG